MNRLKKNCCLIVILAASMTGGCATTTNARDNKSASISNVQLAFQFLQTGKAGLAKKRFMLAQKQDPNNPSSWYGMAYYYEATGEENLAQQYYLKAITTAPNSGIPHNNYGTFLCRRGYFKAAIKQFITAAKMRSYANPDEAYENAGLCALLIPNYQIAQTYLIKALNNNPNRPASLLELAKVKYREGEMNVAKELYQRYLRAGGKNNKEAKQFSTMLYDHIPPKILNLPAPRKIG